MNKLKMHGFDSVEDNIAKIREISPGYMIEAYDEKTGQLLLVVDFDLLCQELIDEIIEG